ncbi:MAG: amino acid permease [Francisellaceae bacterium]|jgi:glutamate:GABA antiporter|nr:amino acid permease [Francisellaceae bacterium]MBT6206987.1 amino acid permease [Francisellaceae bacterium]MBT6539829.1 amino acid permease [Francisellaceae bacterium]
MSVKVLGKFSLAMITVAAIVSLRNLPLSAEYGFSSIFYFIIAALIFFIPTAAVTAELASTWPKAGGSYAWVKEAFGPNWGLFTLWSAWMESIAWFPAILAFTAAMVAYMVEPFIPGAIESKSFIVCCILVIFWGATLLNFAGIKTSSYISTIGVTLGTIFPAIVIVLLAVSWYLAGNKLQIDVSWSSFIPEFKLDNIVIFSGILLSVSGVELAAFHVGEARDPQNDYPKALAIASVIILTVYILGTLAIAIVVPQKDIQLASGLLQAFDVFFTQFNLKNFSMIMALFLFIGSIAAINTWTVGPAKGMLVVAEDGFFPEWLKKTNKHDVPVALLLLQVIIGSALTMLFLNYEGSSAIWMMIAVSSQFTMIQYVMLFLAVIKLRKSKPEIVRGYKAPKLKLVTTIGIAACIFSFFIVYIPPSHFNFGSATVYRTILISILLLLMLPIISFRYYRKNNLQNKKY